MAHYPFQVDQHDVDDMTCVEQESIGLFPDAKAGNNLFAITVDIEHRVDAVVMINAAAMRNGKQ